MPISNLYDLRHAEFAMFATGIIGGGIHALNAQRKNIVYMLWGKYAQTKGAVIDKTKNLVLTSGHPSPFSATLFFGNHHFSKCNKYLEEHGLDPIDWS